MKTATARPTTWEIYWLRQEALRAWEEALRPVDEQGNAYEPNVNAALSAQDAYLQVSRS